MVQTAAFGRASAGMSLSFERMAAMALRGSIQDLQAVDIANGGALFAPSWRTSER